MDLEQPILFGERELDSDGRYLSVINEYTNDVTIIDVEQARVRDKIKTGAGTARLIGTEDGRWLVVLGTGKLSLIEVAAPKKRATIDLDLDHDEKPQAPIVREDRNELLALTKTGLVVVSLEDGRTKKTVLLSSMPAFSIDFLLVKTFFEFFQAMNLLVKIFFEFF